MNIGKAVGIFCNIDSKEYSDEEKAVAIFEVLKMPTHNGIRKEAMLEVTQWLFERCFEVVTEVEQ